MILITGATGNSGSEIVKLLIGRRAPFRAMVRNPAKANFNGTGIEVVPGDFEKPDTLDAVLQGIETALLLSGPDPRQVELQSNFIHAAKKIGVRRIVKFSAMLANMQSPARLLQWHAETEEELKGSGIEWTVLRPNQFMQNFLQFKPLLDSQSAFYAPMRDSRISIVDLRDVAAVAVAALTEPGHESKTYDITGPEALTNDQMAERLSITLGRKIKYVDTPPEVFRMGLTGSGIPDFLADALLELYELWAENQASEVSDAVSTVGKKQPIPFAQFARDYKDSL